MEHNKKECIKTLIRRAEECKRVADNHIARVEFLLDLTLYVVRDVVSKEDALMAVEAVYDKALGDVFTEQLAVYDIDVGDASQPEELNTPICVCVVYMSGQVSDPNAKRLINTLMPSVTFLDVIELLNKAEFGEVILTDTVGDVRNIIIRHPVSKVALYKLEIRKDRPSGDHWDYVEGSNIISLV